MFDKDNIVGERARSKSRRNFTNLYGRVVIGCVVMMLGLTGIVGAIVAWRSGAAESDIQYWNSTRMERPSGEGGEESPYYITNGKQLAYFADRILENDPAWNANTVYAELGSDIYLNYLAADWQSWNYETATLYPWTPIGSSAVPFKSNFDGKGFKVDGVFIKAGDYIGLFGRNDGVIKNLNVTRSYISGLNYIGGVVGHNNGVLDEITVEGTVQAFGTFPTNRTRYIGGITAYSSTSIQNLSTTGNTRVLSEVATADNYTGGIVGQALGDISNCVNNAEVIGGNSSNGNQRHSSTGGIGGEIAGNIANCQNNGPVRGGIGGYNSAGYSSSGGIAGYAHGKILNCQNNESVCGEAGGRGSQGGNSYSGGIAGYVNDQISNCQNNATIIGGGGGGGGNSSGGNGGNSYTGGIAGFANNQVLNCENKNTVFGGGGGGGGWANVAASGSNGYEGRGSDGGSGSGAGKGGSSISGGIVGHAEGMIFECFNYANVIGGGGGGGSLGGGGASLTSGIVAVIKSYIINCFNAGEIFGAGGGGGSVNTIGGKGGSRTAAGVTQTSAIAGKAVVAGIAAYCDGDFSIYNCSNEGNLTGGFSSTGGWVITGGIIGESVNNSKIYNSFSSAEIKGGDGPNSGTGGIVGGTSGTNIIEAYNCLNIAEISPATGTVTNLTGSIGGSNVRINNCYYPTGENVLGSGVPNGCHGFDLETGELALLPFNVYSMLSDWVNDMQNDPTLPEGVTYSEWTADIIPRLMTAVAGEWIKINFNYNGGSSGLEFKNIIADASIGELPKPTRQDLMFAGWWTGDGTEGDWGTQVTVSTIFSEDTTIYARFVAFPVIIILDGVTIVETIAVDHNWGTLAFPSATMPDHGYEFDCFVHNGMQIRADNWQTFLSSITSDTVLNIRWSKIKYTVSFNTDGGSTISSFPQEWGEFIPPEKIPNKPIKEQFTFQGWFMDAEFTQPWDFETMTMPLNNLTLYAQWEEEHVIITFITNTSEDSISPEKIYTWTNMTTVLKRTPVRKGHTFDGWFKEPELVTLFNFNTEPVPDTDITLYAGWTAKSYAVVYNFAGGTHEKTTATVTWGDIYALAVPKLDNHHFQGWFTVDGRQVTNSAGRSDSFVWDIDVNDCNLYARWEVAKYDMRLDFDDGRPWQTITHTYDELLPEAMIPSEPTREFGVFEGWFTPEGVEFDFETMPMPANGISLTARWSVNMTKLQKLVNELKGYLDFDGFDETPYNKFISAMDDADKIVETVDLQTIENVKQSHDDLLAAAIALTIADFTGKVTPPDEFRPPNSGSPWVFILLGAVVLIIIAGVVVLYVIKKRKQTAG